MVAEQAVFPGFEDLEDEEENALYLPEEAQARSAAARERFEELLEVELACRALVEPYLEMLSQGWGWRKALYIAWAKLPVRARWPRTTEELAQVMGLCSSRAIRTWREKNPGIDYVVNLGRAQTVTARTVEVLNKAHEVATDEGYKGHNDRKMLLGIDGVYRQSQDITLTQSPVNADDMAAARAVAEEELDDWEEGRFSPHPDLSSGDLGMLRDPPEGEGEEPLEDGEEPTGEGEEPPEEQDELPF